MPDAAPSPAPIERRPSWEAQITAQALGVPGVEGEDWAHSSAMPFDYYGGSAESPLLISFPHVGLNWPAAIDPRPQVSFARNADFEVDAIYPEPSSCPAARIRARFSRLLVDLNRAEDDVSATLVPDHPAPRPRDQAGGGQRTGIENRGVLWTHAVGRIPILRELSFARLDKRIAAYHRPYHVALDALLEARVRRFGYAILLDAHSMPSAVPHDLVLGTLDGSSCDESLANAAHDALTNQSGLRCSVNHPYRGGEIVRRFGRPKLHVHALQLEVNRGLYMDELRLQLHEPHRRRSQRADSDPQGASPTGDGTTEAAPNALRTAIAAMVAALAAAPNPDAGVQTLNTQ